MKVLVREALDAGRVTFGSHALDELANDQMTTVDAERAMRGGVARPGELVHGEWRYRIDTARLSVVVTFVSFEPVVHVRTVTCFAHKRR